MMSLPNCPYPSGGYALETVAKLLNIASSKLVSQMPYEIWLRKPVPYKHLRVWGSPPIRQETSGRQTTIKI
ncbi:UNVERIFIED_CONTAM: hypothetical protein Sradi_5721800 [Sesamum radiatum]|uniref:Uncharacterized protein n=1 Tax=Sesamum radiatum TaxID=300843 RepID=A0AAW2L4Q2_SESRA